MLEKPEPGTGARMRPSAAHRARDALEQLRKDHELVRKLLREHDRLRQGGQCSPDGKAAVVDRLCDVLSLCALMEEELFYPVLGTMLGSAVLAQIQLCDHGRLRHLIARLDEMDPSDSGYDAAVADIADCVLPSMNDARAVLFVEVRTAGLDTAALGAQMAQRRRAQQQQDVTRIGLPSSDSALLLGSWPPACRVATTA